jgi:hypothetical protein
VASPQALAEVLPQYEVGGELGRGGFGVVLAGRHRQLGRPVAIKELPPQLAADPGVRARFVTEARVLASLDHPHIVPVYDYVERDGVCLLVMESLPGGTVWDSFLERGFDTGTACGIVMVSCAGLHYAHGKGVLHRDVKPENLLFTADGQLKVTDFGIAKVVGGADALATSAGDILGTPAYMAPEQAEGKDLGPPADVYAAGVMLYELLSGKLPFSEEGGGIAIVYRHVFEEPVPLRQVAPDVPEPLADVVMRALARDQKDRYQTPEEFGVAIGEAATAALGPGWFEATGVPVLAGGPILAATSRISSGAAHLAHAEGAAAAATRPARETLVGGAPPPPAAGPAPTSAASEEASPAPAGTPPPPVPDGRIPSQRVRPSVAVHVRGEVPDDAESLVPVRQVLDAPPWPVPWAVGTLVALGLTALVALLGIGAPDADDRPSAALTVAGAQVSPGTPVDVDLSAPVPVEVRGLPPEAAGATEAQLRLSVAGVGLVDSSRAPLQPVEGGVRADLDARANRFLATGLLDAEVVLLDAAGERSRASFVARADRPFYLTVPGVAALAALLFLLAYAEAMLSPLRKRGRRRIGSFLGLLVVGAALGALAVAFSWLLGRQALATGPVVLAAALGAATGLLAGVTATRAGRRARLRRVARKHEAALAAGAPVRERVRA